MHYSKLRILVFSVIFALFMSQGKAQESLPELPANVQAAYDAANGDLGVIAGIAAAFPANAAAIAQRYARANPTKAAEGAATIVKALGPLNAAADRSALYATIQAVVTAVVKEVPTTDAAASIVASVLVATGGTGFSDLAIARAVSGAAIAALPPALRTPSELKTFVTSVSNASGAPVSAIRMGASDGSGVGIVVINRATADASRLAAVASAINAVVAVVNTTEVVTFQETIEIPVDNPDASPA